MKHCSKCGDENLQSENLCLECRSDLADLSASSTSESNSANPAGNIEGRRLPKFIKFILVFFIALGWFSLMSAALTYFTGPR